MREAAHATDLDDGNWTLAAAVKAYTCFYRSDPSQPDALFSTPDLTMRRIQALRSALGISDDDNDLFARLFMLQMRDRAAVDLDRGEMRFRLISPLHNMAADIGEMILPLPGRARFHC
jgi:hypothetical protein